METILPKKFCYTKVKVGQKTIQSQDISALHVSFRLRVISVLQKTFCTKQFRPYTFWYQNILAFDFFWIFG